MTADIDDRRQSRAFGFRPFLWGAAIILLLLPAIAGAPWTLSDYVFAAIMLGTLGLGVELIMAKAPNLTYRAGAVLAVLGAFLTVWVNAAVGMIGSEDNAYNLLFLGVPFVAVLGSALTGFRARGMTLAMAMAAIAQAVLSAIGWSDDPRGGLFSMAFVGIWLLAAALFHASARSAVTA